MIRFKIFTFLFLIAGGILSISAQEQDLIVLKNGKVIEAKIIEVVPSVIRYKHIKDLNGRMRGIHLSDVICINYSDDTYEFFTEFNENEQTYLNKFIKKERNRLFKLEKKESIQLHKYLEKESKLLEKEQILFSKLKEKEENKKKKLEEKEHIRLVKLEEKERIRLAKLEEKENEKLAIGINTNAGDAIPIGNLNPGSLSFNADFIKCNFYSFINLSVPYKPWGFGFLGIFNYLWNSKIGDFYLGGGLGFTYQDDPFFTFGANVGYRYVTSFGMYLGAGAYIGGKYYKDFKLDIRPILGVGYVF